MGKADQATDFHRFRKYPCFLNQTLKHCYARCCQHDCYTFKHHITGVEIANKKKF